MVVLHRLLEPKVSESGLYYLRARYYDAATAEFLSRDPKVAKSWDPYAYVAGDPLNAADPSGLDFLGDLFGAIGAAFGAFNSFSNGVAAAYGNFTASVSVVCPPAGHFLNGLASGFNLDMQESNDPWFKAGQIVGMGLFIATLMTGPEDPLADAAAVRVVSKLPEAAELAGKLPEGAKPARAGSADAEVLYHGTDLASARNIVQSGISKAAARDLGGGDFFWATTKIEDARLFAMANPRGSAEVGIVGIRVMGGHRCGRASWDHRKGWRWSVPGDRLASVQSHDPILHGGDDSVMGAGFPIRRSDGTISVASRISLDEPGRLSVVQGFVSGWFIGVSRYADPLRDLSSPPYVNLHGQQCDVVFDARAESREWKDWMVFLSRDLLSSVAGIGFVSFYDLVGDRPHPGSVAEGPT
jgi:RHS repeat-associated protein